MAYYIAIDGGGTKTEAVLCTGDGGIICRTLAGSTNPNDVGAAESGARLRRAADTLRAALPVGERVYGAFCEATGDEPSPDVRGRFMADYAAAAAENNG